LKSEFLAEGSKLGFYVAAGNIDVFIHQYSSVFGKTDFFNTIGRLLPATTGKNRPRADVCKEQTQTKVYDPNSGRQLDSLIGLGTIPPTS
jgi:hypothetical protein